MLPWAALEQPLVSEDRKKKTFGPKQKAAHERKKELKRTTENTLVYVFFRVRFWTPAGTPSRRVS